MSDRGVCLALHWLNLIAGPQSSGSLRYLNAIAFKSLKEGLFFEGDRRPLFGGHVIMATCFLSLSVNYALLF